MDFVFTETFYASYTALDDEEAELVDDAIRRILREHETGWARQGRIAGDLGSAWILTLRSGNAEDTLYWEYQDHQTVVLIALVIRT